MEQIYQTIDLIVSALKKHRKNNDYINLVVSAEALLEYLPPLITYSVEQEHEYRKFEANILNEPAEKKPTSAYAETQAKATDYYKEWQRSKLTIDWVYEVVNMAKKLATSVDKELNAQ